MDDPRAQSIFDEFLSGHPGGDREEFASLCREHPGHAPRLRELQAAWLRGKNALTGFIADRPLIDEVPEVAGYRVLGVLGSGGMGTVYEAEQLEPVQRGVALKVIKPGMDTEHVLRRFEIEREALARMSHPFIAQLFDAGVTSENRPFFAMELVDGEPLTDFCNRHRCSVEERLRLFSSICRGVQHAHQRGIVHRDLKPGNILVVGGTAADAVPKIIDFGLARAMDDERPRVTLTDTATALGTREYMAPEQTAGADVDARTDVYTLGILLYELLVDSLPPPIETSESMRPSERLGPDVPPSTVRRIAERRRTTVAALRRALVTELDWVVAQAAAQEPERRYPERPQRCTTTSNATSVASQSMPGPRAAGIVCGASPADIVASPYHCSPFSSF